MRTACTQFVRRVVSSEIGGVTSESDRVPDFSHVTNGKVETVRFVCHHPSGRFAPNVISQPANLATCHHQCQNVARDVLQRVVHKLRRIASYTKTKQHRIQRSRGLASEVRVGTTTSR